MRKPIITLLTDFGTKDYYVASMKGAILRINPRCTLIDITHQVSPQNIREGAFALVNAYSSFPEGTIHLSVIDPGVGGPRKPVLFVTSTYFFVGPDNGLFTFAIRREKVRQAIELTNPEFYLPKVSTTFHGRDVFAAVAAHLSLGVRPEALGRAVDTWEELDFREPEMKREGLVGEIMHIDIFGNLITNIDEEEVLRFTKGRSFVVKLDRRRIHGVKKAYWEGEEGELISLWGSAGFLEISVREGNAQKALKANQGDRVIIQIAGCT